MNTKKNKNKNRPNKPPNPNPPQVQESVKQVPEKLENIPVIEKQCETELRVPEIISDTATPQVPQNEPIADEGDIPKKPKRNRGKKKKQDKEYDIKEDQEIIKPIADEPTASKEQEVVKESNTKLESDSKDAEIKNIVPTAPKKKNKSNKKNTSQDETSKETDEQEKVHSGEHCVLTETGPMLTDIMPESTIPPKHIEEIKSSKKKNKKKKRNDSEKSDKAEEISCTAAFQKLINIEDDKTEDLKEKNATDTIVEGMLESRLNIVVDEPKPDNLKLECNISQEEGKNKKKNKKNKADKPKLEEEKDHENKESMNVPTSAKTSEGIDTQCIKLQTNEDLKGNTSENTQQVERTQDSSQNVLGDYDPNQDTIKLESNISKGESKNKRKNKKHVVDTPKYDEHEHKEPIKITELSTSTDVLSTEIKSDDVEAERNILKSETMVPPEENAAITKAKIVKPVDKKRKEKAERPIDQEYEFKSTPDTFKDEEKVMSPVSDPKVAPLKEETKMEIKEKNTKQETMLSLMPEFVTTPQSSMGKKRKKSPKPTEAQQNLGKDKQEGEGQKSIINIESDIKIEDSTQKTVEPMKETEISESKSILLKGDSATETLALPSSASKDVLDCKTGKKRKKSPKLPVNIEKQEVEEQKAINVDISSPDADTNKERPTNIKCDSPQIGEIEIRSVKTDDSEGSLSDFTPDAIQYPRANSQQNDTDDNNNTIIQEVLEKDERKLNVPITLPDTPFIQENITSPELVTPTMKAEFSEVIETKSKNVERTDLKSKMMEVNQDMEELRLSIERSLAELTNIEKSEENIEKQLEEKSETLPGTSLSKPELITYETIPSKDFQSEVKNIGLPVIPLPPPLPVNIKNEKNLSMATTAQSTISDSARTSSITEPIDVVIKNVESIQEPAESSIPTTTTPVCPARKDYKGKGKSKKKGKQDAGQTQAQISSTSSCETTSKPRDTKKEEKTDQKIDTSSENTKQQLNIDIEDSKSDSTVAQEMKNNQTLSEYEPIEYFEDAMTSSIDDVNRTFEMIVNERSESNVNPEINIIEPVEDSKIDKKDEKTNPVSPPKNLLGHPDISVQSNKIDYKKEKNKSPNALAKVKIKDSVQIEANKQSKESQTDNINKLIKKKSIDESLSSLANKNEEFVYKYSFRKVFLPSVCHVCKKELKQTRVYCSFCHLLFYCSQKHKDEDWPQHQALCFAVSTIVHLKEQKHIYEDAQNITGHNYRLLRMQMIVSCEKVLKRKLVPWEQEALLYPRMCADVACREWRQSKLVDCEGCGQISYCASKPDHCPKSHHRWCKSYALYQKLVCYQQTKGRLEPKMPTKVMTEPYQIPEKINEVLASMYKERIDMSDVEYAALTQLATAPLTAVYSSQLYTNKLNSTYANGTYKKTSFTVHVVGAELQFEADALNKWELFFLHLRPDIKDLRVSLVASDLNPSNLPLELLGKVKICESCHANKRRLLFSFQDKKTYTDYYKSDEFTTPDIVCAFNPSIQRSSVYNGKDPWPATINCILKQKVPFTITAYTIEELRRDLVRVKECAGVEFTIISDPKFNAFASVRPDRNFISDDEIPLLFKNYCFAVICGVF